MEGQKTFSFKTSGSTGDPKSISVKRSQLQASARMTSNALNLPIGSKALVCLSVEYIAGIMMMVRGMEIGWELTVIEPSGNPLFEIDSSENFDFIAMVPMQLANCLLDETTREVLNSVGKILVGGAPVSAILLKEIRNLAVPVYQSYGMTETVSHVAIRRLNGTSPQEEYTVLDGLEFGADERGCLYLKGAVTDNKLVQTNDLVKITSGRTFAWLGRIDSIINSGGVKIQLDKVDRVLEEILVEFNMSVDFFHWYENDERLGQKLVLFVKSEPSEFSLEEVVKRLKERVITFEVPKAIYFVDSFERTPTDKLDKRATATYYFTTN